MDWSEERGDSAIPVYKRHASWTPAQTSDCPETQDRPDSPGLTCLSLKSDRSKLQFITFNNGGNTEKETPETQDRPDSPGLTCLSLKSDRSKLQFITFNNGGNTEKETRLKDKRSDSGDSRSLSFSSLAPSTHSEDKPTQMYKGHRERSEVLSRRPSRDLDSVFNVLEEKIITFVRNELKELKEDLWPESSQVPKNQRREDEVVDGKEAGQRHADKDNFLKITLSFLRQMKQDQLADSLQRKSLAVICQRNLKSNLRKKFQCLFEGVPKAGEPRFLNEIYTELSISQACGEEVKDLQEFGDIEASRTTQSAPTSATCEKMFSPLFGPDGSVRTLLTKGVAGIGKTVLTQKFILDWAEEKVNQGIQLIFPFTFRELNLMKERKCSLVELLHRFFIETKEAEICRFEDFQVLFIFDGLDECRLHLDFRNSQMVTDAMEGTSVEVLLTNLIKGTLLPTARLCITTRPAAASQIPPEFIDMVAEVRGFGELQKQEYFHRKVKKREQARRIISHIETLRSLQIMCRVPVFCWISAEVLDHLLKTQDIGNLPQTLTNMYLHFLVVQTTKANEKYHTSVPTDALWNQETKKTIFTLGKLAFDNLEKGNIVFYQSDLETCGIDTKAVLIYSGLLTDMADDGTRLKQEKVFCFVHLSIQEFLAALYVLLTFINNGIDLLRKKQFPPELCVPLQFKTNLKKLFQTAINKALHCPNGDLDLFVRFLLGLSLDTNQSVLRGLLLKAGSTSQIKKDLVKYIKKKLGECPSPEKSIYLLECLNELNDQSLEEEIQQSFRPGRIFENQPSPSQWSAVAFILLSSQQQLDIFDLRTFSASDEGLLWLRPVVKASKRAVLSDSSLSSKSCQALVPVLSSKNCSLRELDLSNNDLYDAGVKLLLVGLTSPNCRLETLRLSGCHIGETGCKNLALALESNPAHLRELDLSFNHPGNSALELLSAAVKNPRWKLETLKTDHCGSCRMRPSPRRFFCQFSLDPNTAATNLMLSENNRHAALVKEKQPYPDHPDRFFNWTQVLTTEGVTGRCYWEVKWNGRVNIGVAYSRTRKSRDDYDCCLGRTAQSWCLLFSAQGCTAWHNNIPTNVSQAPSRSGRVGVYMNWSAGIVSFYSLPSSGIRTQVHLHTFHSTFTEPLFPAFGFERLCDFGTEWRFSLPAAD
ncbi:protein NLRC3-like [Takifugu rubripes]|uniref:protein NLRC3-like n=1 Tax=Takifugu rubripes TaxID=31033 RepID=UPI001145E20A|nr:protein NLRC3-like [Takifugu rubripes]XP_029702605.1 protein NLRC3-like [Takifugu rubripes]